MEIITQFIQFQHFITLIKSSSQFKTIENEKIWENLCITFKNNFYWELASMRNQSEGSIRCDKNLSWKNFNHNTSSNSIVGIYENRVVAYGSIVIENKIRGDIAGHIEDIVVDNSVRGKMVGVKLVKELVDIGKSKSCYRITLFCDKKLIKFYERNGFKVNNVIMKKYLND